jgi:hypothetical protein
MLNISFTAATVRKCSNCGSSGHNKTTCPLLPCTVCGYSGHKSSMCPTLLLLLLLLLHCADLKVVPHNREVLLDWDGHINVEYAGTSYTVLYLYKYLFKGNKKVKATFQEINESQKVDEFFMYRRGRYIDALLQVYYYKTIIIEYFMYDNDHNKT